MSATDSFPQSPDPAAKPVSSGRPASDSMPDEGPVLDTGPSEIDIERGNAGVVPDTKPGAPPETALPPD